MGFRAWPRRGLVYVDDGMPRSPKGVRRLLERLPKHCCELRTLRHQALEKPLGVKVEAFDLAIRFGQDVGLAYGRNPGHGRIVQGMTSDILHKLRASPDL